MSFRKLNSSFLFIASFAFFASILPFESAGLLTLGHAPASLAGLPGDTSMAVYTQRDGLAGNFVTSVAVAQDGAIWAGATTGATRIEQGRWTDFTHLHGLGADWITSLAVAPDGRVWFGTQGGGLSVFAGDKFATYDISNSPIPSNFVTAIATDPKKVVWIGTQTSGAARFDPGANRWTRYGFPNNSITAVAVDASGSPSVGTDGAGAYTFDGNNWKRADVPGSAHVTKVENIAGQGLIITTRDGRFGFYGEKWVEAELPLQVAQTALELTLSPDQIAAMASDGKGHVYLATPNGLAVSVQAPAAPLDPPHPLPVVLVHGWTVNPDDDIQNSEFRFLKQYAEADGIQVFYAQGIDPRNTLFENAAHLRDEIAKVKHATGSGKVNLIGFSMGGLNARAYLESSLYQGDVNRVIILGTPEAGVDIWKPILAQQIIQKPDEPSAIELTPEYSALFNQTHAPRSALPYDLLVGDARKQPQLQFISDLPPDDGLIGVGSALSLGGSNVRHTVDSDLHAFNPTAIPFDLTSYLYPADTYVRYLRNALRDPTNAPLGSEVASAPSASEPAPVGSRNHTPVVTAPLRAGETVTRSVTLDASTHARFLAYFPGGDVDLELKGPDGKTFTSSGNSILQQVSGQAQTGPISLKADIANFVGYSLSNAAPGQWSLVLERKDKGTAPLDVTTYVDLDAERRLDAGVNRDKIELGESLTISATTNIPLPNLDVSARIGIPGAHPGDPFSNVDLPLANDGGGVFSATFTPPRGGYYPVFVTANGGDWSRGSEFLFVVNPGGATLGRTLGVWIKRDSSGRISSLEFDLPIAAQRAGSFAIGATLRSGNGRTMARFASPIDLSVGANSIPIAFDGGELTASGPYTLDLVLLDTTWAAIEVDGVNNAATVQP